MQVKKFEASTMKEALEMVKNNLGPSAIILNAKDNGRGFGLMGQKSIEITAAISEQELEKRKWAESRLKQDQLERLRQEPMRVQKEFIEKSVQRYLSKKPVEEKRARPLTKVQYIDIENDEPSHANTRSQHLEGKTVDEFLQELGSDKTFLEETRNSRVSEAIVSAKKALEGVRGLSVEPKISKATPKQNVNPANSLLQKKESHEVEELRQEILTLKQMIRGLQPVGITQNRIHDVTLHPGADKGVSFELSGVYYKLSQSGVADEHILNLLDGAKKDLKEMIGRQPLVEGWIAKKMLSEIKVTAQDEASPIQIFLGPSGSGKSSSLVKLASHYVIQKNKKVGILTADTDKVGAVEQLRIYSQILNVPFGIIRKSSDWGAVVESLRSLDYVLIDFPESSLREDEQAARIRELLPPTQVPCDRHLVLSATLKDKDLLEVAEKYRFINPTDIIFNKLDEAVTHGGIYNLQKKIDLPLFAFGTGSNLPEDFEFATKERVIDLIFKITKLKN